jgi:cytochrome d ubiquinol oxidase subunit I
VDVLDIARWQFGIITVYHFLFVPLTIGLTAVVAGFETAWVRNRNPHYLRLTKFFGKLMLINFAIGVVTGIVQEFQFGMNWSDYSRFVGDIFGAPLAVEGLLAFFLESTFLGLWIFGWDRLPRGLHATTMWLVHIGTLFSSWFILAANSWMQHPVGYRYNPVTGRAELTDFWAVMFNKVQLVTFPHVIAAAYMTAGAFVIGVGGYLYLRERYADDRGDRDLYRKAIRVGAAVTFVAGLAVAITGDFQGKVMTEVQPMKMAAAEALYDTKDSCAPFSIFTVGTPDGKTEKFAVTVPCVLSFLATGSTDGRVEGINQLRQQYAEKYGTDPGTTYYHAGDYVPVIPVTYWSFRFMIGLGVVRRGADPLPHPTRPYADRQDAALARLAGPRVAGGHRRGQLVRMAVHRDGAAAVGGLRADDHRAGRLAEREHLRGADVGRRTHAVVRRPRRHRAATARDVHHEGRRPVRGAARADPSRPLGRRRPADLRLLTTDLPTETD